MNIGTASKETNVSADTIRYYERIGLIPPVKRTESGIREFNEEDLRWIIFSRQMRNAGLSIESLIEYLSLFQGGDHTVPACLELLNEQKIILEERVDMMQSALDRLKFKIENYDSHMVPTEKKLKKFS
ncbi:MULTISPECIES: MerR family transcriptional regulator [unclassified Enterococcus]|uniref:MerR family transcriptional regulator n=1 Tax=unclassified Enterococcus TaxID=2608891 RepID=UPI001CE216B4|nr:MULTISPECIES: MerR family transcriptional regulator [unclassified Enterococcus]MCA5011619.1 MerR family transcriptional regulator [Enterococcus sp. S23]MCA5014939.1 MerR family transcriptional regulator [Enterococcus sp. S22(2020)]